MLQDASTPTTSISVLVALEDSLSPPVCINGRRVWPHPRTRMSSCHHKRTFHWHWCLDFPDSRSPQYSKREEKYTCWRVGKEYLLASCRRCSSRNRRAFWGYLVKQDHWGAPIHRRTSLPDWCVDEWKNFGTDCSYFAANNSHPAVRVLRTRWRPRFLTYQLQFRFFLGS